MLNKHILQYVETTESQESLHTLLVDTFSIILVITFNRPAVRKFLMLSMLKALNTKMFKFIEY